MSDWRNHVRIVPAMALHSREGCPSGLVHPGPCHWGDPDDPTSCADEAEAESQERQDVLAESGAYE